MNKKEILIEAKILGKSPSFVVGKHMMEGSISKKAAMKLLEELKEN